MNTHYNLKNFRVFDENGVSIDLRPITILTGCNSSGKSSIVKSLLLLEDFIMQINKDRDNGKKIDLANYKLDFTKTPNNSLGNFEKVLNRESTSKEINMEYTVHSLMLGEDVTICFTFGLDESDTLKNGYLKSYSILNNKQETICSSNANGGECGNFNLIKENFVRFAEAQDIIANYQTLDEDHIIGYGDTDEKKMAETTEKTQAYIKSFNEKYGIEPWCDIVRWVNAGNTGSLLDKYTDGHSQLLEEAKKHNILYYFPLIGEFDSVKKDEVRKKFGDIFKGVPMKEDVKYLLNRMLDDFEKSSYETFAEYYSAIEQKRFSYEFEGGKNIFNPKKSGASKVHIIKPNILNFQCTFLWETPFNRAKGTKLQLWDDLGSENDNEEEEIEEVDEARDQAWLNAEITLPILFELFTQLQAGSRAEDPFNHLHPLDPTRYCSSLVDYFYFYIKEAIEEILLGGLGTALSYVSSSIVNVKRLYTLDANDDFTNLLRKYCDDCRKSQAENYVPNTFINKWVKLFGIGDAISIESDKDALGVTLRLHKSPDDKEGTLLADCGFGVTQLFAIMLRIESAIMEREGYKTALKSYYPGVLGLLDKDKTKTVFLPSTIAVEEPEIHLHPRYQSLLAEMFRDAFSNYNIHFIIETHSEYLIRKLQTLIGKAAIDTADVSINYVYDADPQKRLPYTPHIKRIMINEDGRLDDAFGTGFFDEADNLVNDLFNIKMSKNGNA